MKKMKKLNPEEIKVGDKIMMEDWSSLYFVVEHIGETRLTGTLYYPDRKKEDFFSKYCEWYLYEEPKKKKLVAPFAYENRNTAVPFYGVIWGHKFMTYEEAVRFCAFSDLALIKWYSELAVEVDDE